MNIEQTIIDILKKMAKNGDERISPSELIARASSICFGISEERRVSGILSTYRSGKTDLHPICEHTNDENMNYNDNSRNSVAVMNAGYDPYLDEYFIDDKSHSYHHDCNLLIDAKKLSGKRIYLGDYRFSEATKSKLDKEVADIDSRWEVKTKDEEVASA